MLTSEYVGILYTKEKSYPKHDISNWFRPSQNYPEAILKEIGQNKIYGEVRSLFHLYHMDEEHYGTGDWNPLGDIIKQGDNVLLKPNMVMDYNQNKTGGTDCLYTQTAVVVPIIDYALKALNGTGSLTIGDAPMQECNFEKLAEESGYKEILAFYKSKGIDIGFVDFRELTTKKHGIVRHQILQDGREGTVIDLKSDSEFAQYDSKHLNNLRITNYSPDRLREHHCLGKHEYYVSDCVLKADVVINLPKPKTHRKAGFTAAMKNMVGINVRKEYLPHHTIGSKAETGDEYEKKSFLRRMDDKLYDRKNTLEGLEKYKRAGFVMLFAGGLKVITRKIYKDPAEGSWYGNETISKTITDLNKILLFADKNGQMQEEIQRKVLSIGDMIVAGEKEGPVMPSPKQLGVLVIGVDSYNFDSVVGAMMGADISRIAQLNDVKNSKSYKYKICQADAKILVVSNKHSINSKSIDEIGEDDKWKFEPSSGWREIFIQKI